MLSILFSLCWINSLDTVQDFCSEMNMDGTFWVLTVDYLNLVEVEKVGGACCSVFMSQIILLEFVSVVVVSNRETSGSLKASDVFDLSVKMTLLFFFAPFLGYRSPPFLVIGADVSVTVSVVMIWFLFPVCLRFHIVESCLCF